MSKIILITGSTDGIGYETAKILVEQGHHVLLHGRNQDKLDKVSAELMQLATNTGARVESYRADLSNLKEVTVLASGILAKHSELDVLINNAGIFKTEQPITSSGLDVRFVVNTLAPYLLTQSLLAIMDNSARIVNLSSAAQAPIDLNALAGSIQLQDHFSAYAQSKLAITIWSQALAKELQKQERQDKGPMVVAVNPGSMLASKMVKEGFGMAGNDIRIGADILLRAALADEFAQASGQYFDNDSGQFSLPHPDAQHPEKTESLMQAIKNVLADQLSKS